MAWYDTLLITKWTFLALVIIKTVFYIVVIKNIWSILGKKNLGLFWEHYTRDKYVALVGWRMGAFLSLLFSYAAILLYIKVYEIESLFQKEHFLAWFWLIFLVSMVARNLLGILSEWRDLENNIRSLQTTLRLKSGLRTLNSLTKILTIAYPVASLGGWAGLSLWSQRALIIGKGAALFERWFDQKVHDTFYKLIVSTIFAAILETLLKIAIVTLAVLQKTSIL